MRRTHKLIAAGLVALSLQAPGAGADDSLWRMFSFAAFGTLDVVHSSEDQADFTSSSLKPNGAGHSRAWSADVDSRIGGQVTANITPKLSAVVQVISEQRYDNSYWPTIEWANVQYQFTPDFSIRAGRTVLPPFLVSDYRKVGYANPWVRPPVEVYNLVPLTNLDGVDVSYRLHLGGVANTLQGRVGQSDVHLPSGGGTAKARDNWDIIDIVEFRSATVHVVYGRTMLDLGSYEPLFDGFRQFGAQGAAIADRYDPGHKPLGFFGVGASYDPGNWFVMGEWGTTRSNSVLGARAGWYVSGGYRFGQFTPYLTYAQAESHSNTSAAGLDTSGLPPPQAAAAAALNAGLNAVLRTSAPVQKTISFGTRWDFAKNLDFKLQYDHSRLGAGSAGMLTNLQPGFHPGGSVNLFSAAIDFVF